MKTADFSTFVQLLEFRAETQRDEILYHFLDEGNAPPAQLSYAQLQTRAQSIGAALQDVAAPGERVLLLLPPGLDLIAAFFGCLYAGVAAIPLPPPHPARLEIQKDRLLAICADARPAAIISQGEIQQSLAPIQEELAQSPGKKPGWIAVEDISQASSKLREISIGGETIAFLQYTSGSTARPKGVLVSHENLLHNSDLIFRAFDHSSHSKGVIWLPPYHDMGLIGGVLQPLFGGFPVTLMAPTSFLMRPLRWLQTISETRATTSGGPNFAYDLCAKKITAAQKETLDLSSWNVAFAGAEPVRAETLDAFADAFTQCGFRCEAFLPCYGLAESTLFVTGFKNQSVFQTTKNAHRVLVGAGSARDLDVRIVSQGGSTPIAGGEIGEVWVSGQSVARGYWNRPQETDETFGGQIHGEEKLFLRTGDLGFFQNGELFLTGRSKDLIIVGGRNHFAEDIETTAKNAHESVVACAAFPVETENGEQLALALEIEKLARVPDETQNEISAAVRQEIAARHDVRAHDIQLVRAGSLPRTPSGKIQRHLCAGA
jgi:acyl-CoA synthetase (AMP-forming)/AMP-acid ligase II